MIQPIRIQRKRTRSFSLQSESLTRNGLPCVYVGRPTKWGNPYKVGDRYKNVFDANGRAEPMEIEAVLTCYEYWLKGQLAIAPNFLKPLRGKNLACFCKESEPCHADILLEVANDTAS